MAHLYKSGRKWRLIVQSARQRNDISAGSNYEEAKVTKKRVEENCREKLFRRSLVSSLITAGLIEKGVYKIKYPSIVMWDESVKKLLNFLKNHKRAQSTVEMYRLVLKSIKELLHPQKPSDVTFESADRWIEHLCKNGGTRVGKLGTTTINMRITIAKACFKRFKSWDIADENPFEHCDMFAHTQILPNPLTENDLRILVKTSDRVLKRAVKILVFTGMRPDEYYHLTWKRVILGNERVIHIEPDGSWVPKCRYERNIPLSDAACKALGKYGRPDSLVMGMSEAGYKVTKSLLERRLRRTLLKAGLSEHKYTLYSLRDTYATNLALEGYEAHTIAARLGHRSIETSMRYVSLARLSICKHK